jgi:hypothetical protein
MAASQAELNRAPIQRLATTAIAAAPTDGTTLPHRIMSPRTVTLHKTTGFALGLKAPSSGSATAVAAGFSVVIWIYNPVSRAWFACAATDIGYNQAFVTFDFNASGLYFQVAAASVTLDGNIDFHCWEQ